MGIYGQVAPTGDGEAVTLFSNVNDRDFEPVVVNLKTGDHFVASPKAGSLSIVAHISNTMKFVVARALHIWDANARDSYVLSK